MKALGQYDSALEMFIEEPRELDQNHLDFLKWLIEHERLVSPRKVDDHAAAEVRRLDAARKRELVAGARC